MKYSPTSTNVILRPEPVPTTTKGGIVLPDVVRDNNPGLVGAAVVVAVGPGGYFRPDYRNEDLLAGRVPSDFPWVWRSPAVKPGDRVLYALMTGAEVDDLVIIPESGIVGLLPAGEVV